MLGIMLLNMMEIWKRLFDDCSSDDVYTEDGVQDIAGDNYRDFCD